MRPSCDGAGRMYTMSVLRIAKQPISNIAHLPSRRKPSRVSPSSSIADVSTKLRLRCVGE
eukprot:988892-Rhodomonas_salina.4